MLGDILDSFYGLLEHTGPIFPTFRRRSHLPAVGTQLRTLQAVRLSGRDLQPQHLAHGFVVELPKRTFVRVERLAEPDGAGCWVQPLDHDVITLLPAKSRASARAYGYALDVPPGILKSHFEIVPASDRAKGIRRLFMLLFLASAQLAAAQEQPSDVAAIRTARAAQNQAIAAGDTAAVANYWTDDVEIRRGLGQLVVGRSAYLRLFVPESVAVERGTALVYERTPISVEVSTQWPLAYEAGEWIAHLGRVSGPVVMRGRYSAQWVKRGARWLIRGEVYVALSCAGVGCNYASAP